MQVLGDAGSEEVGNNPPKPKSRSDGPMPVGRLYLQWDGLSNRIVRSAERQGLDNDNWMLPCVGKWRQAIAGAACRVKKLFFGTLCRLAWVGGAPKLETAIETVHL